MVKQKKPSSTPRRMTPEEVAQHLTMIQAKHTSAPILTSNQPPVRKWNKAIRFLIPTFLILGAIVASMILVQIAILYQIELNWYIILSPIIIIPLVGLVLIKKRSSWMGFQKKTLWDWLSVILIPIILGIYALTNSIQQTATMQQQSMIADQQLKSGVLQSYSSTIQDLILHEGLLRSGPNDNVRTIATTQTLLALRQLDQERKGDLLLFIYQLNLINQPSPIISLIGADLSGVSFEKDNLVYTETNPESVNLSNVDLRGADLTGANLSQDNLKGADLSGTELRNAELILTNFSGANLNSTDLSQAHLISADFSGTNLEKASLNGAIFHYSNSSATLRGADLRGANLSPIIEGPTTHVTDLTGVDLRGADFSDAYLLSVIVTSQQLSQVKSLKGTLMPDGSKHP